MPAPVDFQLYARPPRIDADGGIALVRRLVRAGYKGSSPATAAALVSVRGAAGALQEELKKRARTARTSLRPLERTIPLIQATKHLSSSIAPPVP